MAAFVRAAALRNYAEVARRHGLDPRDMIRRAGLPAGVLADPDQRVPAQKVVTLLERSAEASGCPTFGLQMAEDRQVSDLGVVSLLLDHQPTLRHALQALIDFRHLLNEALALYVEEAGDAVILREEVVTDRPEHWRQATELAVGVLFRLCAAILESSWKPRGVHFTHAAPPDLQVHRRLFLSRYGTRLAFDSDFNGIVCAAVDLDRPAPSADPVIARYAQRFVETMPGAEAGSVLLDVRKAIYLFLPMGRATVEQVAEGLGVNVRTLQRRLDEEGASFSDVLNGVRRDLAVRYLESRRHSLARAAELLGYAAPGSFTRWFTGQFGLSPSEWRKRRAASGATPLR